MTDICATVSAFSVFASIFLGSELPIWPKMLNNIKQENGPILMQSLQELEVTARYAYQLLAPTDFCVIFLRRFAL